jgi:hypothetical protein
MTTMCQLTAEVGEDARFPELARGWFAGVLADLLPDVEAGLAAGRALYKRDPRDASVDTLWGEPHAVHAILQVTKKPNGPIARWVQYSPAAWRRFLDGMSGYPYGAVMGITPLDENGRPFADEGTATIEVSRLRNDPRWAMFSFTVGAALAGPSQVAGQWTGFARQQAEAMDAVYAEIGHPTSGFTLLEYANRSRPEKNIPQSRTRLRGYSWATLVPPELVSELGGIGALRASGAFDQADELSDGAAWLQATANPGDYDEQAARQVFEALAPVLIGGMAERWPGRSHPPLAFGVNADDYRREDA